MHAAAASAHMIDIPLPPPRRERSALNVEQTNNSDGKGRVMRLVLGHLSCQAPVGGQSVMPNPWSVLSVFHETSVFHAHACAVAPASERLRDLSTMSCRYPGTAAAAEGQRAAGRAGPHRGAVQPYPPRGVPYTLQLQPRVVRLCPLNMPHRALPNAAGSLAGPFACAQIRAQATQRGHR